MPRPITHTLRLLHGGTFLDECSEMLAGVVRGVDETGKPGKLTITLDIRKTSGALAVAAKVTDKTPEKAPDADLFYPTAEGNLSLDNPNQRKLDLREAGEPPRVVRNADAPAPEVKAAAGA